jgi:hypothetical protein
MSFPGLEKLLDEIEWEEVVPDPKDLKMFIEGKEGLESMGEICATHHGILKIADFRFKVYRLSPLNWLKQEPCETYEEAFYS